MVLIIS